MFAAMETMKENLNIVFDIVKLNKQHLFLSKAYAFICCI